MITANATLSAAELASMDNPGGWAGLTVIAIVFIFGMFMLLRMSREWWE